ncbi:ATPase, T2SS/T4P/T4SS family [Massilia sp. MP_M2]|uniref:ATPase, T2SS/T4P/T4SS family n=1 Tax=Massilia sp. MP_M2 TaxID=3071713 RepID=UPI00319E4998
MNQIAQLAKSWGWLLPSSAVLEIAQLAVRLHNRKSGEALVEIGAITQERLDALLDQKPESVRMLEWVAQTDPSVRTHIEKVLALRTGHAYYETLEGLTLHGLMQDPAVLARCDDLDACLMLIEDRAPVLVFSAYNDMLHYASAGLEQRLQDEIRKRLGGDETVLVAVGKRDQVIARLGSAKGKDTQGASNIVAMWYGANATDKYEKIMSRIIDHALTNKVTDIAISPVRGAGSIVEVRLLGDMVPCPAAPNLSIEDSGKIVDFLLAKSGANPNLSKVREPRDGNIIYRSMAGEAEMRLSFIPVNQPGEYLMSVSIRILARTATTVELKHLKIDARVQEQLGSAAKMTKGFILVVGGTNTGKSTTIAGALQENYRHFGRSRKRLSLEKPVERLLMGVTQINVPAGLEKGFDSYLEAFKRHDPDIIFIGEILGPVTANTAVAAAISGHLVLSTTHANDTLLGYDSVAQMLDPNKRYQFIESLTLIVAQDMVREICSCGSHVEPTEEDRELFKNYCEFKDLKADLPEKLVKLKPGGCKECGETGVATIRPINEVLQVTGAVKNAMFAMLGGAVIGPNGENYRDAIANARSSTLFQAAMDLVNAGKIELGDALK